MCCWLCQTSPHLGTRSRPVSYSVGGACKGTCSQGSIARSGRQKGKELETVCVCGKRRRSSWFSCQFNCYLLLKKKKEGKKKSPKNTGSHTNAAGLLYTLFSPDTGRLGMGQGAALYDTVMLDCERTRSILRTKVNTTIP